MKANHKDGTWRGIKIERGCMVTGREKLSEKTGLSIQQIRTSLKKLKSTNDITIKTTKKYSIITISNYNQYQTANQQPNQQLTNNQPTSNQQVTTNNNNNNNNKKNNIKKPNDVSEEVWSDFVKLRKNKKANITKTALKRILSEAGKVGWPAEEALAEMVARGWVGFKADWVENKKTKDPKDVVCL